MVKYNTRRICEMVLPVDPENVKTFDDKIVERKPDPPAKVIVKNIDGRPVDEDLRVRIKVPGNYIRPSTSGNRSANELKDGIIFPYTPSITYDYKASYKDMTAAHSNYTQYFYQNSSISQISIQGKFTVQSDKDAVVWLNTKHLLASLTKMRYGEDAMAGAPPPVCRLFAYGDYMLKNVPIVITSFRLELSADVDYYSIGTANGAAPETEALTDENGVVIAELNTQGTNPNFIPVMSTFVINCNPIYSRREMLNFSVTKFIEDYPNNTKYL